MRVLINVEQSMLSTQSDTLPRRDRKMNMVGNSKIFENICDNGVGRCAFGTKRKDQGQS